MEFSSLRSVSSVDIDGVLAQRAVVGALAAGIFSSAGQSVTYIVTYFDSAFGFRFLCRCDRARWHRLVSRVETERPVLGGERGCGRPAGRPAAMPCL